MTKQFVAQHLPEIFGGFVVLWCAMSFALSFGGWRALARDFAADDLMHGRAFRGLTGRVGATRYRNCLHCFVCDQGLFLAVALPFRFAHPPLFLPWSAIYAIDEQIVDGRRIARFNAGEGKLVRIRLPAQVLDARPDRS